MTLTDIACRRAAPQDKLYKLTDGGGLTLRITPAGGKYWVWRYRFDGRQSDLSLGSYPSLSLAQARQRRDEARQVLLDGIDPALHKVTSRISASSDRSKTFEVVARAWLKDYLPSRTPKYGKQIVKRLEDDIFPWIGRIPIAEIDAPRLLYALKKTQERGVLETTQRLKQYCGMILRYAIAHGYAKHDVTADIKEALRPPERKAYATISSRDLPALIASINGAGHDVGLMVRLGMKLLMLTFLRTGELIGGRWEEIDLEKKQWIIPAARMKARRDHIVPLSGQAVAILERLKELGSGPYLLPGRSSNRQPVSNNTILFALHRLGWGGKMTGHGFRALATTVLREEMDYPMDVIDLQLAHGKKNKVQAAYDRAQFLPQRAAMMQAWGDYIDRAEAESKRVAAAPTRSQDGRQSIC